MFEVLPRFYNPNVLILLLLVVVVVVAVVVVMLEAVVFKEI